jgi:hypothetical protein
MPAPQPELPHPAHIDRDSALGRKFGKETTNYFGSEIRRLCGREDMILILRRFSIE